MNLIEKLKIAAGIKINQDKHTIESDDFQILQNDSNDVVFAKTLLKNNGNFFYCDKKDDLVNTLKALTKKLNANLVYCTENVLQDLLSHSSIKQNASEYGICDAILSSCEYLIAHHGKIMLSSKQLGPHDIKNLPKEHIVIAYTSQIVKNLTEAMSGINTRYIHEGLPSTITTITSKNNNENNDAEGNIKNLSVLLIEDFQY